MKKHLDTRAKWGGAFSIVFIVLVIAAFLVLNERSRPAPAVVGKGSLLAELAKRPELAIDQGQAREAALADERLSSLLPAENFGFLSALLLGEGESRPWRTSGCEAGDCALVTFYDYNNGGTVEAVLHLASGTVVDRWQNTEARPGASAEVLPRALSIAAADSRVADVIGDVRSAQPVMGPMSAYLLDDDCRQDWCVDLTFAAPDGSGRVFHAFVNMEQERVARTFYSRARADRPYSAPPEQDRTWDNGCHEQYGWSICWEMTAHDGIDFRDATFEGETVFSSAKIAQVEVWYPSWPGGYRDEVGFASSVPPAYGTHVDDLGNGFQVSQLYTEFLAWPNCICCYRYEQIHRFYADGSFDLHFISHGPGCDDPMQYRAFWRIDLDLEGPEADVVEVWQDDGWVEVESESEFPIYENLSPDDGFLITSSGDMSYLWTALRSDPFGEDEALMFLVQHKPGEGDGPIVAGPPNSFWPPRQWISQEALSGENIVLWYIPLLNGTKSEPYWCLPDPAPDFSPCYAELRIEPYVEPEPTATPPPTATQAPGETRTPTATPEPTQTSTPPPTAAPTATPRPISGETPQELALNAGCLTCHLIGEIGEAGKVGPDLSYIGDVAGERVPGQSASEYLRNAIINPSEHVVSECPNGPCLAGIMPRDYQRRLTSEQVDTLVSFLLEQSVGAGPDEEAAADEDGNRTLVLTLVTVGLIVLTFGVVVVLELQRRRAGRSD